MNASLANAIGRPDLKSVLLDRHAGTSGGQIQSTAGISAGGSNVEVSGRLTAGVALVALAIVVGFYIWTRDVQA